MQLVCLVVLVIAVAKIIGTWSRSRGLQRAPGVIVAHQPHQARLRSASGYGTTQHTLLKPVVRFTAPDGRVIDVLHPNAYSHPPAVGSAVAVTFDPQDPTRAEVVSGLARYFASLVTLVAVGLLLASLVGVELSILG